MPRMRKNIDPVPFETVLEDLGKIVDLAEKSVADDKAAIQANRAYRKALSTLGKKFIGAKFHSRQREKELISSFKARRQAKRAAVSNATNEIPTVVEYVPAEKESEPTE